MKEKCTVGCLTGGIDAVNGGPYQWQLVTQKIGEDRKKTNMESYNKLYHTNSLSPTWWNQRGGTMGEGLTALFHAKNK